MEDIHIILKKNKRRGWGNRRKRKRHKTECIAFAMPEMWKHERK